MTEAGRSLQDIGVDGAAHSLPLAPADDLFRQLFEDNFDRVCRNLRRLGVSERDLEDAAHEVFIVVHRRLDEYDRTRPLLPWLFGITLRVASDVRHRPRYKREMLQGHAPDEHGQVDPLDLEARWTVLQALEALSEDQRAVLVMHDLEEYTMPEIAQELAIPLNTAYSRLRLARAEVKRVLSQDEGGAT